MIVPSGFTETQTIKCIQGVVNRIAPRYTFYGYTVEDVKQEAFIICMEALPRYDSARPLENFLSVHLSNRMKNFVRDNHFVSTDDENRVKVYQPAQLEHENHIVDTRNKYTINEEKIDYREMQKVLDKYLPASYRFDYLKMINDVYITKQRREEITEVITQILKENGYEKRED